MKYLVLPPMNPAQEAKTKRLIDMISEFMGSDISFETVISMKVNYPDDRKDVEAILKRLAGNKTGLVQKNTNNKQSNPSDQEPA